MPDEIKIYLGAGRVSEASSESSCLTMAGDRYHLIYRPGEEQFYIEYSALVAQIGTWSDQWPINEARDHVPADIWEKAVTHMEKISSEHGGCQ